MLGILSPSRQNIVHAACIFSLLVFMLCGRARAGQQVGASLPRLLQQTQSAPARTGSSNDRQPPQTKKGLTPLRNEEAPEGSRVTITYNLPLSDYSAYRQGDRFVVVIPKADAPRVRGNLRGRGFDGVQVERRGDDAVLSFRIQPGVRARVNQQFNKLEVVFSAPERATETTVPGQPSASSPSTSPAIKSAQTGVALPAATTAANHNSAAAGADQSNDEAGRRDSSAEVAGTPLTQSNGGAAPGTGTLAPSSEINATQPQSHADGVTAAHLQPPQSPPVSKGEAASVPLQTSLRRNWLLILIAALLLASAYGVVAARRRAERSSKSGRRDRKPHEQADTNHELGANGAGARPNSAEAMASAEQESSEEEANSPGQSMEAGAETAEQGAPIARSAVAGGAQPDAPAPDTRPEAAGLFYAGAAAAPERQDDQESPARASTGIEEEKPEFEPVGAAEAQSNRREAVAGEADRLSPVREPAAVDEDLSGILKNVLESLNSGLASERAAAVTEMARLGGDDAFLWLGAAFDDPAQQVRDAAARSLFNMSADRASSFKRIMRDASRERRRRIGAAIASSGMAREALNDLTGESGARAYDALLVLSLMAKAGEVQPLVTTIEEHPSTEVRLAIVKLLALSGRQEILSSFRYLATRDSLPVVVRSSIMEAIYEINNQKPLDQPAA